MDVNRVLQAFGISTPCTACEPVDGGHIHRTFRLVTDSGCYILQELRGSVDYEAVTAQAVRVSEHLRQRDPHARTLHFYPAKEGWLFEGCRLMDEIPGTPLPTHAAAEQLEAAGYAYGRFAAMLSDLKAEAAPFAALHDTRTHLERLKVQKLPPEVSHVRRMALTLGEAACALQEAQQKGLLPTRTVHGDTKTGNVLLLPDGRAAVIDLDTVMPGLTAYDYGDGIRSAAADGAGLDPARFRAFTRGYLRGMPLLTDAELDALVPGIFCVTTELALRYLNDLAEGCGYFHKTPSQTLERAEALLDLAFYVREQETALRDAVNRIRTGQLS